MKMRINLNTRLLLAILAVTVPVFISTFGYMAFKLRPERIHDMENLADAQAGKYANLVRSYLTEEAKISRTMADNFETMENLSGDLKEQYTKALLGQIYAKNPNYRAIWMSWERSFLDPNWNLNYGRVRYNYFKSQGKTLLQIDSMNTNGDDVGSLYHQLKTSKVERLTEPYTDDFNGETELIASVTSPIVINGKFAGLAGIDILLSRFKGIISQAEILYGSVSFLVANDGVFVGNQTEKFVGSSIETMFGAEGEVVKSKIAKGKAFTVNFTDENDEEYYVTFQPFQVNPSSPAWMVGVAVPYSQMHSAIDDRFINSSLVALLGLLILAAVVFLISRSITLPLTKITKALKYLSNGEINRVKSLEISRSDEIGDIADSTNTLIEGLTNTAMFAKEIGQGNLEAHFKSVSENDVLGNALIDMRQSLANARKEEEHRRLSEDEQKWATAGFAKFGELLRNNTDNIEEFSYNIIMNLIKYTQSNQGGFFLINDEDEGDKHLQLVASYAYERRKYSARRIELNENLVGQCYLEAEPIFMTEVPNNYVNITSGLGSSNPRCLLIVPLRFNDMVYGVIEMASFSVYQPFQINFIEKVAESIASTISTVKVNLRTIKLLEESKLKSEELAAQEEEMRQNMEELQTTQEESARRELEMNGILNALNSSYMVAELDLDANIISINENALHLLGISKEAAEGHNLRSFLQNEEVDEFDAIWEKALSGRSVTRQRFIVRAKGRIAISESYTPIFDEFDNLSKILNIGVEVALD
jgi:methyl-accepting chemotaxis protein